MRRFLFDTAVFVYATGGVHPLREPCKGIVSHQASGRLSGAIAAGLLQEYVHQRYRQLRDRPTAVAEARDVAALCRVHAIGEADAVRALTLFGEHAGLNAMDAVFAAVALNRGIGAILSPDRGFDGIPGLERVDPADERAVAALAR